MHRWNTAAVGGLVALSVFAAMPANAAVTPVPVQPPVAPLWTSSELAALRGAAPLAETVGGITATAGAGAGAATAVGAAFAPVGVAIVGAQAIQGTSWVMHSAFGVGSGSFTCDVTQLFNPASGCATASAPSAYVPNSDVTPRQPGYDRAPAAFGIWGDSNGWNTGSIATAGAPLGVPAYGATGGFTLTLPLTFSGTCTGGAYNGAGVNVRVSALTSGGAPVSPQLSDWVAGTHYAACGSVTSGNLTLTFSANSAGFGGLRISGSSSAILTGQTVPYIDWYPVGSSLRPPDVSANPTRNFTTTWTCADGSSGTATSSGFTEADATWPTFPTATCPASSGPVKSATVTETGSGVASKTVGTVDASGVSSAFAGQDPKCATGGCTLDLLRVDANTGTQLDCNQYASVCAAWWTETQQATTNTTAYQCTYGGAPVALTECTVLAHAYDLGVYSDPATGEPVTPPAPSGGSSTCPPPFSWTSLVNPWWYYKGALCAMQEAFVPDSATLSDQLSQTQAVLSARPPFSLLGTVAPIVTGLGSGWGGACSGSLADFTPNGLARLAIPCNPGDIGGPGFTTLYALVCGGIVVGTAFSVWYLLGAAIGAHEAGGRE